MIRQFLISILIISLPLGITIGSAEAGLIEFKKKYVTNSPDVCGDKMCDEHSEYDTSERMNRHTPMGQYNLGIPIYKITCKTNLSFVLKTSNWHPACVKPDSVQKLVDIGWAANPEETKNIFSASAKKDVPQFAPLKEYRKEYPLNEGLSLSITSEQISGEWYLIFDGYGWHRLHNVEITISDESGEVEFMMSQTDDRGDLYLPWKISDSITNGRYHIFATDGIHDYEINIPISAQN